MFHCTTEHGSKLVPLTVSRNAAPPAVALAGESELMTGTGSGVVGVVMEKVREFELVAELETVIAAVPRKAASVAEMVAVSCVELTKVVGRGEPFQFTTSPFAKSVPFTVSVKLAGPQYGVEDGESEVRVGATIENVIAPDVPPPGVGVNTVTGAVPTEAISVAEIAALSCVVLTNVVVRLLPFHCTTEHGTKPLPVTFKVNAAAPAVALAGESDEAIGAGSNDPGAVTEKLTELEMTEPLDTVMAGVPCRTVSEIEIKAVSCVELTKVVGRGEPFQLTIEPFTKFVPFTVSVKPVWLHDGVVLDEVVEDESDVMAGGAIVNVVPVDVPPPGPPVNTIT